MKIATDVKKKIESLLSTLPYGSSASRSTPPTIALTIVALSIGRCSRSPPPKMDTSNTHRGAQPHQRQNMVQAKPHYPVHHQEGGNQRGRISENIVAIDKATIKVDLRSSPPPSWTRKSSSPRRWKPKRQASTKPRSRLT